MKRLIPYFGGFPRHVVRDFHSSQGVCFCSSAYRRIVDDEMPSPQPNNPCYEYEDLLEQIAALKSDLQSTVNHASDLANENTRLKQSNDDIAARTERIQSRNKVEREATLKELQSMRQREKERDDVENERYREIESLQKENDAIRAEMAKSDKIHTSTRTYDIRRQIQRELQQKHDEQVSKLRNEMEGLRNTLSTVRRESETYRDQCSHIKATAELDIDALTNARSIEVSALKAVIKKHIDNNDGNLGEGLEDDVRALKIQVAELTASNRTLMVENGDFRAAVDAEEESKENLISSQEQKLSEALAQCALAEADKLRAVHRIESLERQLAKQTHESKQSKLAREKAEENVSRLEHLLSHQKTDLEVTVEKVQTDGEMLQQRLLTERDNAQARIETLEQELLCNDAKPRDDDSLRVQLSKARDQVVKLRHQHTRSEHNVSVLQGEKKNIEAENKRLIHACETCKFDCDLAQQQKEILAKQCSTVTKKAKLQEEDIVKLRTELQKSEMKIKASKEQLFDIEERYHDVMGQNETLESKVERIEQDLSSSREQDRALITDLKEKIRMEQKKVKQEVRMMAVHI